MEVRMSIRNESIFPRDPNGNRDNSIVKANEQLTQAFSDSPSTNGPAKGSSFILNALLKLITQLIMLLENRETPSKPDSKKEVPSKPEIVMEKEKSEPGKTKPQNGGEGARGVYGGAIGWNGPAQEKETPSKPEPEIEKEKPEPEKLKPQIGEEGARGVYGGAIGWTGSVQEK